VTKEGEKRNGRKKEEEALDFRVMTQGGGGGLDREVLRLFERVYLSR